MLLEIVEADDAAIAVYVLAEAFPRLHAVGRCANFGDDLRCGVILHWSEEKTVLGEPLEVVTSALTLWYLCRIAIEGPLRARPGSSPRGHQTFCARAQHSNAASMNTGNVH